MRSFFAAVWLLLSLKCEKSSRFISEGLDGDLSKVEAWSVKLHFITCKSCRRFRESMDFLRMAARKSGQITEDQLDSLSPDFQLTTDARDRIAASISARDS